MRRGFSTLQVNLLSLVFMSNAYPREDSLIFSILPKVSVHLYVPSEMPGSGIILTATAIPFVVAAQMALPPFISRITFR